MNRADMVQVAVNAMLDSSTHNALDCGPKPTSLTPTVEAVLDAVLPQVSTVAELEALPAGTKVIAKTDRVWWRSGRVWRCETGLVRQSSGLIDHGPLTVVWQP